MLKIKITLTIIIIICFTAETWGQNYISFNTQMNRILQTTKYQVGPFRLFPAIRLRQLGYNNNIFRQYEDLVADFTLTVSPELDTYLLYRERLILSFLINPEYVFYYNQADLRGWNRTYSPEIKWRIFNGFVLSGIYMNSTSRQRPSSEFSERINFSIEGYTGKFFYERPNNSAIGISFMHNRMKYRDASKPSAPTSYARLDREEKFINLEFYYPILRDSQFFLKSGYTEYNFDLPISQEKNSYSYQILTGIGFPLLGNIRGTISIGYNKFMPREEGWKDYSGLIGNTRLEYRISRLNLRILYSRDIPFSLEPTSIYFIQDTIGGGISFYLSKYIRLDYNISYSEANYPETTQISSGDGGFQEIKRKDKYLRHNVAIVFRLIRNTGLGLALDLIDRDSNLPRESYQSKFIGIFFTLDF